MKHFYKLCFTAVLGCGLLFSCGDGGADPACGTHNGKALHKGPNGGCYYTNSNGNKTYVDRSECKC